MKDRGLTRDDMKTNRTIVVPPLKIKTGFCKSEMLTLEQINKGIEEA